MRRARLMLTAGRLVGAAVPKVHTLPATTPLCSFLLRDLKAKAAFECEESWAGPTLCTLDIPGLTPDGGFQSYCAAAECRLH